MKDTPFDILFSFNPPANIKASDSCVANIILVANHAMLLLTAELLTLSLDKQTGQYGFSVNVMLIFASRSMMAWGEEMDNVDFNDLDNFVTNLRNEKALDVLIKMKNAVEKRIIEVREEIKGESIDEIRKKIELLGLNPEDLFVSMQRAQVSTKKRRERKAPEYIYVNPDDSNKIYKGFGPKPKWLKDMSVEDQDKCKKLRLDLDQKQL